MPFFLPFSSLLFGVIVNFLPPLGLLCAAIPSAGLTCPFWPSASSAGS